MSRPRLFCQPLAAGTLALSPEESHHAAAVLRCKPGQEVVLFDGAGHEAVSTIKRVERRKVWVEVGVIRERPFELSIRVTLAIAMPKPHRQGYLIEKCTELGAAALWPIVTEHSLSKPRVSTVEKWKRRAVEAAKQSGRAWVPVLEPAQRFSACLKRAHEFDAISIACPASDATPLGRLLEPRRMGDAVLVLIGPEGGWSEQERETALAAGAVLTTLSPNVLRTETAAVVVCAVAAACGLGKPPIEC